MRVAGRPIADHISLRLFYTANEFNLSVFFDYFESKGPPEAFRGRSEKAAGFVRDGNPYGD